MENHGILGWRRWSTVRKAQVIAAMIGASATLILMLMDSLDVGPPRHSQAEDYFFMLGIVMLHGLAQLAGLRDGAPAWQWETVSVVLNTFAFCAVGTIIGLMIRRLRHKGNVSEPK